MRAGRPQPRPLRVREAADLLGVSASTVRRWADGGRLPSIRTPSGQRRFAVAELQTWAAGDETLLARLKEAERRHDLLLATSLELASSLELGELLQSAARRLCEALAIPDCDIYRLEERGGRVGLDS